MRLGTEDLGHPAGAEVEAEGAREAITAGRLGNIKHLEQFMGPRGEVAGISFRKCLIIDLCYA